MLDLIRHREAFSKSISLTARGERLHVMATSTGYDTATSTSYRWDGRQRGNTPFAVLQHTLSGQGRLRYERHSSRVMPGETMLVLVPHHHCYWVEPPDHWEFFWIALTGKEALRLLHAVVSAAGPVFRLEDATVDRLAACCLELADHATKPGVASALAYDATMALYDDLISPQENQHTATARVVAYIRKNLESGLDVQKLADISGLSRAHFSRVFAREQGMSPADFVMRERIERAGRLLTAGYMSIKTIAHNCGFDDPNYFAKAFRRVYGLSPSEFRSTGMYGSKMMSPSGQDGE